MDSPKTHITINVSEMGIVALFIGRIWVAFFLEYVARPEYLSEPVKENRPELEFDLRALCNHHAKARRDIGYINRHFARISWSIQAETPPKHGQFWPCYKSKLHGFYSLNKSAASEWMSKSLSA